MLWWEWTISLWCISCFWSRFKSLFLLSVEPILVNLLTPTFTLSTLFILSTRNAGSVLFAHKRSHFGTHVFNIRFGFSSIHLLLTIDSLFSIQFINENLPLNSICVNSELLLNKFNQLNHLKPTKMKRKRTVLPTPSIWMWKLKLSDLTWIHSTFSINHFDVVNASAVLTII